MRGNDRVLTTFGRLIANGALEIGDGYRAKNEELGGDGPIFLRAGHVTDTHIDFAGVERFHSSLADKVRSKMSQVGDAIVTTKGNSTGRTAFVADSVPQFVYSPHLSYWRSLDPKKLKPGFLRFWSKSAEFTGQLAGMKASTDMAPYLSLIDQRRLEITLPSPEDQDAIANILGALDDKIELNRRMNDTLEAMARALFKSWFVDFDPVRAKTKGLDIQSPKSVASLFPDTLEESELGEIPKGWHVQPLAEMATLITKGTTPTQADVDGAPKADTEIRYVRVNSISEDGEILPDKLTRIPKSLHFGVLKRSVLLANDLLYTIAGTIGRSAIVQESLLPANTNQAVAIIRLKPTIPTNFLALAMQQERFREELHRNIVHAVQANLSLGTIAKAKTVLPPEEVLSKLFMPIDKIMKRINSNRQESRTLAALRDTLLPKLISGELRVKTAEKMVEAVA